MRYELLLQAATAETPFDVEAAIPALGSAGAISGEEGAWRWTLPAGEVEVGTVREGGNTVALDLRIPLSDKLELVGEALKRAAEVASGAGLKLVDPQLGRAVSERDEALITEQFLRTARYAGEMAGVPEAVLASFAPEPEGLKPMTKVLLALGGLLVLLYFAVDAIGRRM